MMTLKEMPKIGDKVRYIGKKGEFNSDVTYGNIYEITESYSGGVFFVDDTKEEESGIGEENFDMFELVTEPTEAPPVVASPSVIELLSNLALRLTKVEDKIGNDVLNPKEADGTPTQLESVDNVNSPQHYRHGRFETIELIEGIAKKYDDGFVAYCVGNAVKYVDRAPFKHGSPSEDLRKAAWYLTRAAEHMDEKGAV